MKASPEAQQLLLSVQELDTKAQQLDHRAANLAERAQLATLLSQRDELRSRLLSEGGELDDARAELKRVADDAALVVARIERNTRRAAETGSAKDAQALEHESAALRKRLTDLEDVELAVMERVEALESRAQSSEHERVELDARISGLEQQRDLELQRIADEHDNVAADRRAIVNGLPADLVELYERQRSRYGVGAAYLRGGVSLGSNVKLSPSDLDAIRRAAPDDVVLDPESGCILVRDDESGL